MHLCNVVLVSWFALAAATLIKPQHEQKWVDCSRTVRYAKRDRPRRFSAAKRLLSAAVRFHAKSLRGEYPRVVKRDWYFQLYDDLSRCSGAKRKVNSCWNIWEFLNGFFTIRVIWLQLRRFRNIIWSRSPEYRTQDEFDRQSFRIRSQKNLPVLPAHVDRTRVLFYEYLGNLKMKFVSR